MVFLTVYQREPHARQMGFQEVLQPKTYEERCELATRTRDELELHDTTILVDGMDDQSRALFGDLPSPAIVVAPDGTVADKLPWAEPVVLGPRLRELIVEATAARTASAAARGSRSGLVEALAAVRSQGAPTALELDRLADAVARLDADRHPRLVALGLVELAGQAEGPALLGVADGALSRAFQDDPDRHAALLASLAETFADDPRTAALLDRIDALAGDDHPEQRGWAQLRARQLQRR